MVQVWSGFTPILTHQNMAINLLWYSLQPYNSHTHIAFFPHKHAGHIFLEPSLIILLAYEGPKPHTCHYLFFFFFESIFISRSEYKEAQRRTREVRSVVRHVR